MDLRRVAPLAAGGASLLHAANGRRPFARRGPFALPSFGFGLAASELPLPHAAAYVVGTGLAGARSCDRRIGLAGLGLAAGAAAIAATEHRRMRDVPDLVEAALAEALGDDQPRFPPRMAPRTDRLPLLPTPRVQRRHVHDERVIYGEHGRRTSLDIWRRSDVEPGAPVLIQIHGGGWVSGNQEVQAYPLMSHLVEQGWVCVAATYRLAPWTRWPAQIRDVKRVIAWTRDNVERFGGDPSWLAITGGSAGGHLVSLAALTANDPELQPGFEDTDTRLDAAVSFYGVYDWTNADGTWSPDFRFFLERLVLHPDTDDVDATLAKASPRTHVRADAPPFLFVHGDNDSLAPVEDARTMVAALREVSTAPVGYLELPSTQHAFDLFGSARTDAVVRGVGRFLDHVRHGAPVPSRP